jgi:parallel beta-helix repeat protein
MRVHSCAAVLTTAVATVAAGLAMAGPAAAHPYRAPHTVYVAASAAGQYDHSCRHAGFTDIQAAIGAVADGGTVVVCRGTYHGMFTITHRMTLAGRPGAVIDATGMPYGVGTSASWVTIRGLTVQNASPLDPDNGALADGILTAGLTDHGPVAANHVRIIGNTVKGNLGSGIDLNSTSYSMAVGNRAVGNGVGINVSDDLGLPAAHNLVSGNVTNENFGGCGIALADHTGAGVIGNVVTFNRSDDNGLSTPTAPDASAGSGVILASPIPNGLVRNNTIAWNEFHGNGHGGVVVHSHVPALPDGTASDFRGNSVIGNVIGTNNLRQDQSDPQTTGIYLGSATPLTIKVAYNLIHDDHYGIFTAGDVTVTGGHNRFVRVSQHRGSVASY